MSSISRTPEEIATIIESFLDGNCGKWDWDDLCSLTISDANLDHVRVLCSSACFNFPPTEKGHFCSSEGRAYLREIARTLREGRLLVAT
jgi:hypothetical protein